MTEGLSAEEDDLLFRTLEYSLSWSDVQCAPSYDSDVSEEREVEEEGGEEEEEEEERSHLIFLPSQLTPFLTAASHCPCVA